MISTPHRQTAISLIDQAVIPGARRGKACAELEISDRTLRRPELANKLSAEERAAVLDICNSEAFTSLPPIQIVPNLADQGSKFTSKEWLSFLCKHNLCASMSQCGNCHDNAVAESFFQLLKRERIRRRTQLTRYAARQYVFDYIEIVYNPNWKHTNNGMLSLVDYEDT